MDQVFEQVAYDPYAYARKWKARTGKEVIGYFCSYVPEEIIFAADILPLRVFGKGKQAIHADGHLQVYSCSLVRGGLEEALNGNLSFLDGTVFPHTCDSIQRLSDIWRINAGIKFHFDIVLPVKLNTNCAHDYMKQTIYKFKRDLEKAIGVKITDEKLYESINLYNKIRSILNEIYELKSSSPGVLSGSQFDNVIKAGMIMDRSDYLTILEELAIKVKNKVARNKMAILASSKDPKRVIIAGGICNHPDFFGIIEDYGASVVWDELCTGTRFFEGLIDNTIDPVDAIAKRYIKRIVCPAKHNGNTSRGDNLIQLVKEKKAQGVIFIYLNFCDPQSFDYPYIKEALNQVGIPSMLYEVDEQSLAEGQIRTRFETFIDML